MDFPPKDVCLLLLDLLNFGDTISLSRVNKKWHSCCTQEFWFGRIIREWKQNLNLDLVPHLKVILAPHKERDFKGPINWKKMALYYPYRVQKVRNDTFHDRRIFGNHGRGIFYGRFRLLDGKQFLHTAVFATLQDPFFYCGWQYCGRKEGGVWEFLSLGDKKPTMEGTDIMLGKHSFKFDKDKPLEDFIWEKITHTSSTYDYRSGLICEDCHQNHNPILSQKSLVDFFRQTDCKNPTLDFYCQCKCNKSRNPKRRKLN